MDNLAKLTPTGTELLKSRNGAKPVRGNGKPSQTHKVEAPPVTPPPPPAEPQLVPGVNVQFSPEIKPALKPPLKIALVGTAPSSRDLAPYKDESWQIWCCSPGNAHGTVPRADVWFEIHSNLLWPEAAEYGPKYVEWLKQQTFPIYMQNNQLVPNATPLPIQELVAEFGRYFFTSSFAYMLAMAIRAGAAEIALFGIDMASQNEYILQRPGGHYFMQKAAERGIIVSVPYESDLAQPPPLYGYDDSTPFCRKLHMRRGELTSRIAQMETELAKLQQAIPFLKGALEDLEYTKQIWSGIQT
jgi:hypothetical protein